MASSSHDVVIGPKPGGGRAELIGEFLEFEEENGLFAAEVRGRCFWDCIRPYVFERMLSRRGERSSAEGKTAGPPRRRRYATSAGHLLKGVSRAIRERLQPELVCDVAVVNYDRWTLIDGQRANMNCFPLVKALSPTHRILVIDPYDMRADAAKSYPESVVLTAGFSLVDRFKSLGLAYSKHERALFRQLAETIRRRFDVSVDVGQLMRTHYAFHIVSCARYRRLFESHRPRAVVAAHHDYSAAEAAHESGVPMIELQHSMISSLNIPYNYPDSVRAGRLPTMPDFVFTFGEYWNDKFNMPSRKVAVGFPFFDAKSREIGHRGSAVEDDAKRSRSLIVIAGYLAKAELVETVLELSSLLPETTIFYKLKSSDYERWRERYPEEFWKRPNIQVIDSDAVPLYEYFTMCAWALGVNSGGLYEALAYGVTPFILKAGFYEESRCLYEEGYACLIDNAGQIAHLMKAGSKPRQFLNRESLFKSHALEHMAREIRDIVKRSPECQSEQPAETRHDVGGRYGES